MKYVTFLRGINMLSHNRISMEELRNLHQKLGFSNIQSVLNSGNIIFETESIRASEKEKKECEKNIFKEVSRKMNKEINIHILPFSTIEEILKINPFSEKPQKNINYISLIYSQKISKENTCNSIEILPGVLATSIEKDSIKMMNILNKEYGKKITTRNWNTIVRISKK